MKPTTIIPVWNQKLSELKETLESIKNQPTQVIVVDDGSENNGEIKKLVKKYEFKYIYQKNKGPASARNLGLKNAKSEIIIFLDADCVPEKDFIKNILQPLEDKNISGVQGDYITKNKNSFIARFVGYEIAYRHRRMTGFIDHIATYACAYRKKVLGKGFLTKFNRPNMEDIELSYRLFSKGKKLVFEPSAKVSHTHIGNFTGYLKQQFKRGYWRVLGHYKYPKKLIKDSYFGNTILIQGILSLLFIFFPSTLFLLLLYISNIPLGYFCFKSDKSFLMGLLAPFIASCRSVVGVVGFGVGVVRFMFGKIYK